MKMGVIFTCATLLSAIGAANEVNGQHFVGPKAFYRNHTEKFEDGSKYEHHQTGVGLEYGYIQSQGINVNLDVLTNLSKLHPYIESNWKLRYMGAIPSQPSIYPYVAAKATSHLIHKDGDMQWIFSRHNLHFGVGKKWKLNPNHCFDFHIGMAKDLYTTHIARAPEWFGGTEGAKFLGIKGQGHWQYSFNASSHLSLDGEYTKTFRGGYQDFGGGLTLKFGF